MTEAAALVHAVDQALLTVASTTGLSWEVKGRISKLLERRIGAGVCADSPRDDFAEWCQSEMVALLENEDIRPLCRLSLAAWFAQTVLSYLSGDFDNDEAA